MGSAGSAPGAPAEPVGAWAVKTQPQTPRRHGSDLIFSYQA